MTLQQRTNSVAKGSKGHFNCHFYNLVMGLTQRGIGAPRSCPVEIIIPVYNAYELTKACISSVLQNSDNCRLLLVNDASTDQRVKDYLDSVHNDPLKNIEVIVQHNEANVGFLKTVNDAYQFTAGHFVILNSDTEVPPGWLDRLFAPILASPNSVASVTPFSNASMGWLGCNFPDPERDTEIFKNLSVSQIDSFFSKYSQDTPIEIFSGCGFCMAFNRAVVKEIGLFDYKTFGKGFGEEVDWSLRASSAGYKNVLSPDLFVYHKHGGSFDPVEKQKLVESNVEKLQNNYSAQMQWLGSCKSKAIFQALSDALAIISDTHTKRSCERWICILGGDAQTWNSTNQQLSAQNSCIEDRRYIFVTYSVELGLKLQVVSPDQDRILYLPSDACDHIDEILTLLNVDIVILLKQSVWPRATDLMKQLKFSRRPFEIA